MVVLETAPTIAKAEKALERRLEADPLGEYFFFDEGKYFVVALEEARDEPAEVLHDCGD